MSDTQENTPSKIQSITDELRNLIPRLIEQETSVWKDLRNRPGQHFKYAVGSPAVNYSLGNIFYTGSIGYIAGIEVGTTGAIATQSAITLSMVARQMVSTYNGDSLSAPFRIQGAANLTTAGLYAAQAVANGLNGQVDEIPVLLLPAAMFASWGAAHFNIANYLDRLASLQADGKNDDEIAKDPTIKRFRQRFQIVGGTGNVLSAWKATPIDEMAKTLAQAASDPVALTRSQLGSVLSLPLFITGLAKGVMGDSQGRWITHVEESAKAILPDRVKKWLGMNTSSEPDGFDPYHYHAGGYTVNAIFSAAAGQPSFAAAYALWTRAALKIASGREQIPLSADEHTAKYVAPENI